MGSPMERRTSGVAMHKLNCHDSRGISTYPSITLICSNPNSEAKNNTVPKNETAGSAYRLNSLKISGISAVDTINAIHMGVYGMIYFL